MIARRSFLLGLGAAMAAPAIIRPGILMPVKKVIWPVGDGVALTSAAHPIPVAFEQIWIGDILAHGPNGSLRRCRHPFEAIAGVACNNAAPGALVSMVLKEDVFNVHIVEAEIPRDRIFKSGLRITSRHEPPTLTPRA